MCNIICLAGTIILIVEIMRYFNYVSGVMSAMRNRNRTEILFCFDLDNMSIIYTLITYTLQDQDIKQICTCTKAT